MSKLRLNPRNNTQRVQPRKGGAGFTVPAALGKGPPPTTEVITWGGVTLTQTLTTIEGTITVTGLADADSEGTWTNYYTNGDPLDATDAKDFEYLNLATPSDIAAVLAAVINYDDHIASALNEVVTYSLVGAGSMVSTTLSLRGDRTP